ncbi:hypothetical protein, partial [Desulfurobacterium sp.]
GIDPGVRGGIAIIPLMPSDFASVEVVFSMPDMFTLSEILFERRNEIYRCFVEKQQVFPKQGVVSQGKLMKHYGEILGILTALRIPFEEISPPKWQREIHGSSHRKKSRKEKKKASIQKARQLFPCIKIRTDGEAEALLIAEYGKRILLGRENVQVEEHRRTAQGLP